MPRTPDSRPRKADSGVYEVCLFEDAVIYVPESAPVFLRIQYEFGVSAAEAAENVERLDVDPKVLPSTAPR